MITAQHRHVDCPPDRRNWLESRLDQAATMMPHTYCLICGKVKNSHGHQARKLGFYLSGLASLKEYLERNAKHRKMTQTQSRLIAKALEASEEFEDSYSLSWETQAQLYLDVVKRVRSDLCDELVLRLLPKIGRRTRKPLIEMMAKSSAS